MGKRLLDGYTVEVWLRDNSTFKTAPITSGGRSPNPYVIFTETYIKALEKAVTDGFLTEQGTKIVEGQKQIKMRRRKNDSK